MVLIKLYQFLFLHRWQVGSLLGLTLAMVGMLTSNVVMSIGSISMVVYAVLSPRLPEYFQTFYRQPALVAITLIFFIYLFWGINSTDEAYWGVKFFHKLPFLGLPLAFAALRPLSMKIFRYITGGFFLLLVIYAIVILAIYLTNLQSYNSGYLQGHAIPTPLNHIRFSLIIAFGSMLGLYLLAIRRGWIGQGQATKLSVTDYLLLAGSVFLIVFLHILAVRSGLLALYLSLIYSAGYLAFKGLKPVFAVLLIAAVIGGGLLAVKYIPSLHNRIEYARYDMQKFRQGQVDTGLSDATRLASLMAGLDIAKRHPVFGCGIGDIKSETAAFYHDNFPKLEERNPLPHNQYLTVLASTGAIGFIFFLIALLTPFFHPGAFKNPLFIVHQLVVLPSMMTENLLDTELGMTFYLIFVLFCLNHLNALRTLKAESD